LFGKASDIGILALFQSELTDLNLGKAILHAFAK